MEKIDYTTVDVDPLALELEPSNHDGKNVLLTLCENSDGSQDMIGTENTGEIQYEIRNVDGVFQYRFINSSINNNTTAAITATTNGTNDDDNTASGTTAIVCNSNTTLPSPTAATNCQFFVINDVSSSSRHCLISPKISSDSTTDNKPIVIGNSKKRDERRRATHNEVERRRRDKINQWIFKLRDLLPDNQESETTKSSKSSTSEYSKGGILIRACEYIRNIKDQNQSLQECLKENEDLHTENTLLREELIKLQKENERLKILFAQRNIKNESELVVDFETS